MLRLEDVELLSRFVDGELSPAEAQSVERRLGTDAELREALHSLREIDAAAPGLAEGAPFDARAIAARAVQRSANPVPRWPKALAVAAAVVVAGVAGLMATKRFGVASTVAPRLEPLADLQLEGGKVTIWSGASYQVAGDELLLEQGSLWVSGSGVRIVRGPERVVVNGDAFITTEPSRALTHVTPTLDLNPGSDDMRARIEGLRKSINSGAAHCVAGALLTFCAADGAVAWANARPTPPRPATSATLATAPTEHIAVRLGAPIRSPEASHAEEVSAVIQGASAELARCFEVPLAGAEATAGQFHLSLQLDEQGRVVRGSGAEEYSTRNPLVAGCVLDRLASLRFPQGQWDHPLQLVFAAELEETAQGRALVLHLPQLGAAVEVATGDAPSQGPTDAPVTLLEYTDYECGFCAKADATVRQVLEAYPGKIRWVVKQRPLPSHPHARLAAKAALAAHAQGKFWAFHALLMQSSAALDRASIEKLAVQAGLDLARFDADVDGTKLDTVLQADWAEADRAAVQGVPAFVINGHVLTGAQPLASFKAAVDAALAGHAVPVEPPTAPPAPANLNGLEVTQLDGTRVPFTRVASEVTVLSFISSLLPNQLGPQRQLQELADSLAADPRVRFVIVDVDRVDGDADRKAVGARLAAAGVRIPVVFEESTLVRYVNAHLQRPENLPANQFLMPTFVVLRSYAEVDHPHTWTDDAPLSASRLTKLRAEVLEQR